MHPSFFDLLTGRFPSLSQTEIRLTALVKLNLGNKEIATLLNIESKSVHMARYRLRKRLNLGENDDLNRFVRELSIW